MRTVIAQASLHAALQHVMPAAAVNPAIPALSGIRLQADAGGLTLTGSNEVTRLQYHIPSDDPALSVLEEGGAVIPARRFGDLIRYLGEEAVALEAGKEMLQIRTAGTVCRLALAARDASEFREAFDLTDVVRIRISNRDLKRMVKQVSFAAASSEARMVLTGVLCRIDGSRLSLTATDGIRLAFCSSELEDSAGEMGPSAVIPAKSLSTYAQILGDAGFNRISIGTNAVELESGRFRMLSSLLGGAYPSVDGLKPARELTRVTLHTASLLQAVEGASVLSGDQQHLMLLTVSPKQAILSSASAGTGEMQVTVPWDGSVSGIPAVPLTVSFNGKYMKEMLRSIASDRVQLVLAGPDRPIILEPVDDRPGAEAYYLLTPIRTPAVLASPTSPV
ncbi:DNA polymerase III subunit beta [Paenibacillus caseinilyticus]|uniref:Beta sliding clamp n=1 Tax=Paenibacillus mucilaginosus K02 TaxID=997761 RepID=I0BN35_9BACL|nr:DNA polymerase III subunit beta [Paenibacillus mucilaginosus]AFH63782.1 DNA polymerase III subunit beta [Paenibacillus mucilaginosus K02]